jgi:hypothetical protein
MNEELILALRALSEGVGAELARVRDDRAVAAGVGLDEVAMAHLALAISLARLDDAITDVLADAWRLGQLAG